MEAIKNAIGLGTTATHDEGREPVSGVTGSGVGGEPYDQGNADDSTLGGKAPQHTEPYTIGTGLGSTSRDTTTGLTSSDGVTSNAASATSASGPAVDPTSSNTTSTSGPHSSNLANKADPRVDSDNDRNTAPGSTGGIGSSSWMSTALPHREGNNTSVSGTTAQRSQPEHSSAQGTGLEDVKSQPPNILPTHVPTGVSTDFVAPGSTPTDPISGSPAAATGSVPSGSTGTTSDPMHAHQDVPGESVGGSSVPSAYDPSHSLQGSRGSIAPEKPDHTNAPLKPAAKGGDHGINPDAIPLAGGKKIGEDAYTERKSIQVDSLDDSSSPLPTTTSANTARNVGTAEATGTSSTVGSSTVGSSTTGHEQEKASVTSGSSDPEHKEKKGLMEKIKEKVHHHKH